MVSATDLVDEVIHLIDSIVEGCGDMGIFRNSDQSEDLVTQFEWYA